MIKQFPDYIPAQPTRDTARPPVLMTLLLALITACAAYVLLPADMATSVAAARRELPIYSVERPEQVLAISFDAAWGGDQTMAILDILDEYDVKTTFFLVDIWTHRFPELVKEIDARGHEIGNHSTSHPYMSKLSEEQIVEELFVMSEHVRDLIGKPTTLFRPPYGDYDNLVVTTARREGYEVVQWNVDSLDWKNRGAQDMIKQCTKKVGNGDIVLFHNDSQYILDALPAILDYYRDAGYDIVPVSELLLDGSTTIDHTGRQFPVSQPETQNE